MVNEGKKYKLTEYSRERCQYVDLKVCGRKVNGLLEVAQTAVPRWCLSTTNICSCWRRRRDRASRTAPSRKPVLCDVGTKVYTSVGNP